MQTIKDDILGSPQHHSLDFKLFVKQAEKCRPQLDLRQTITDKMSHRQRSRETRMRGRENRVPDNKLQATVTF